MGLGNKLIEMKEGLLELESEAANGNMPGAGSGVGEGKRERHGYAPGRESTNSIHSSSKNLHSLNCA